MALLFVYFLHYAVRLYSYCKGDEAESMKRGVKAVTSQLYLFGAACSVLTRRPLGQLHPDEHLPGGLGLAQPAHARGPLHHHPPWQERAHRLRTRTRLHLLHDCLVHRHHDRLSRQLPVTPIRHPVPLSLYTHTDKILPQSYSFLCENLLENIFDVFFYFWIYM